MEADSREVRDMPEARAVRDMPEEIRDIQEDRDMLALARASLSERYTVRDAARSSGLTTGSARSAAIRTIRVQDAEPTMTPTLQGVSPAALR